IVSIVGRALAEPGKRKEKAVVEGEVEELPLIGRSPAMQEIYRVLARLTRTESRFQQAEGGTLFLDEIGDMPMEAQTRLLRVLQEGEYTTVGGRTPIKTDVRIIAATHRELKSQIQQGLFREDLYYRLNVVPLRLPPLRERLEDIGDLVRHFLRQTAKQGLPQKAIETAAIERLKHYHWPGNVRELENMVR